MPSSIFRSSSFTSATRIFFTDFAASSTALRAGLFPGSRAGSNQLDYFINAVHKSPSNQPAGYRFSARRERPRRCANFAIGQIKKRWRNTFSPALSKNRLAKSPGYGQKFIERRRAFFHAPARKNRTKNLETDSSNANRADEPGADSPVSFADVTAAARRLKESIVDTPFTHSRTLSRLCQAEIFSQIRKSTVYGFV